MRDVKHDACGSHLRFCFNCRFSQAETRPERNTIGAMEWLPGGLTCRKNPPVVLHGSHPVSWWPRVTTGDWCGAWEKGTDRRDT